MSLERARRNVLLAAALLVTAAGTLPVSPLRAARISAAVQTTVDPAKGAANDFFGLTKVYTFHLTIAAEEFQRMPPRNGRGGRGMGRFGGDDSGFVKVPATLQFDGKDWGTIAVRYKGNSSYRSAPSELKRSLKLDFDAADKSRTFFGMTKLNLNNNAFDPSQMREALAYDVFHRADVPAPRTAFAKVFITVPGEYDRTYAGLFTVIEEIDQTFFKERWGKKVGVLLKPEGLRGMPDLGGSWPAYASAYASKITAKPDDAARFMAFVTFVNQATDGEFASRIGEYLDVDEFLHFLAGEVVLVNNDSPLAMNHNYWLTIHPSTHKVVWVPWDMNMAFGGFMSGDVDLSVRQPSAKGMFPLADRVLAVPALVARYERIVREMTAENVTVSRLSADMRTIAATIRDAVRADRALALESFDANFLENPYSANSTAQSSGPVFVRGGRSGPPLRLFVGERIESVIEQLDGKRLGVPGRSGRGGFGGPGGPGRGLFAPQN